MKHVVFVETNANGLDSFQVARDAGHYVTFIKSGQYDHFYANAVGYAHALATINKLVETPDVMEASKLAATLEQINRWRPIDAVMTVLEHVTLPLARAAELADIAYLPSHAVETARDKALLRQTLVRKGVRSCAFVAGEDPTRLLDEAEKAMGYPVILKPASGFSSLLVKRLNSREELHRALLDYQEAYRQLDAIYRRSIDRTVLVEQFLNGKMVSLEMGAINGNYIPLAIADRKQYSENEAIELGGTMPIDLPPEVEQEIHRYGGQLLQTIGFTAGIFHIEMMLTTEGPVVFDLNPRIAGGSGGGRMLSLVLGHSIYESMIDFFLGDEVAVASRSFRPQCYATDRELVCHREATYCGSDDLAWLEAYRDMGLTDFILGIKPGDHVPKVGSNNDVIGTIVVKAESEAACKQLADEIVVRLRGALGLPLILA